MRRQQTAPPPTPHVPYRRTLKRFAMGRGATIRRLQEYDREAPQFGASDLLITREAPYSAPCAYQARRNQAAPLVLPVVRPECRSCATCHLRHAVRSQRVLPRCRTSPGLAHLNPGLSRFDDATRITLPAAWLLADRFLREGVDTQNSDTRRDAWHARDIQASHDQRPS